MLLQYNFKELESVIEDFCLDEIRVHDPNVAKMERNIDSLIKKKSTCCDSCSTKEDKTIYTEKTIDNILLQLNELENLLLNAKKELSNMEKNHNNINNDNYNDEQLNLFNNYILKNIQNKNTINNTNNFIESLQALQNVNGSQVFTNVNSNSCSINNTDSINNNYFINRIYNGNYLQNGNKITFKI
jgi:hypothetical protein